MTNVAVNLQIYAGSFFTIPLIRWFLVRKRNAEIEKRNRARLQYARSLEMPDISLRRKVNYHLCGKVFDALSTFFSIPSSYKWSTWYRCMHYLPDALFKTEFYLANFANPSSCYIVVLFEWLYKVLCWFWVGTSRNISYKNYSYLDSVCSIYLYRLVDWKQFVWGLLLILDRC